MGADAVVIKATSAGPQLCFKGVGRRLEHMKVTKIQISLDFEKLNRMKFGFLT